MNKKIIMILIAAVVAGYWLGASRAPDTAPAVTEEPAATEYTCSMHPQIRQPMPGVCPICAMDLIPVAQDGATATGPREVSLSASARARAQIETAPVMRGKASQTMHLAGTLAYVRSNIREITMLAEGQIRKLHVYSDGQRVKTGEPLADVYSPDVYSAIRELIAARDQAMIAGAARQKLRLLGVDDEQIDAIHEKGALADTFVVRSPSDGLIGEVNAHQGQWFMQGEHFMDLIDDSELWAELDAYEQDLPLIVTGQTVDVTSRAVPGTTFRGTISSIGAGVDAMARNARVRVVLENKDGQLKAGMFVQGIIDATLPDEQLMVPASAVLLTGKRAMVYVQPPGDETVFEGRVIVPGPRVGDYYVVAEGLAEGERVVSRGAMRVDSAMQLLAKPSMMSLPSGDAEKMTRPQTHCPIAGNPIERDVFVDYQGMRIYFCCPGCDEDFLKDPEKYLGRMRAEGIEPEASPATETIHTSH